MDTSQSRSGFKSQFDQFGVVLCYVMLCYVKTAEIIFNVIQGNVSFRQGTLFDFLLVFLCSYVLYRVPFSIYYHFLLTYLPKFKEAT